jgi:hypothetical protein
MWVAKDVHPTSPLRPGISDHCVIMNFMGETFFSFDHGIEQF